MEIGKMGTCQTQACAIADLIQNKMNFLCFTILLGCNYTNMPLHRLRFTWSRVGRVDAFDSDPGNFGYGRVLDTSNIQHYHGWS